MKLGDSGDYHLLMAVSWVVMRLFMLTDLSGFLVNE
jgi:hypothetical protein